MGARLPTVLVIDDSEDVVDVLAQILPSFGFRPLITTNGEEGVAKAESEKPSVVLCDYSMPGMNGAEVLKQLRSRDSTHDIPFVLMSGRPVGQSEPRAEAFLQKPFEMKEMIASLKAVILKGASDDQLALQQHFGDLTTDYTDYTDKIMVDSGLSVSIRG